MNTRSALYKNSGKDAISMHKSRVERALTLRKEKREENMAKRRNIQQESERSFQEDVKVVSVDLEELVVNAKSDKLSIRLQAAIQVRKMLSVTHNPPIDEIISSGMLPILVNGLQSDDSYDLQFESAWALTNIASGTSEQTKAVVEAGAVPQFLQLLRSNNIKICEQAILGLVNIIANGTQLCDLCVELVAVDSLIKLVRPDVPLHFLSNVCWILVNLVHKQESALFLHVYEKVLPSLAQLLHHEDSAISVYVILAFCYICDTDSQQIQVVINHGVVNKVVSFLTHKNFQVLPAAIRCVGNISTGTDEQAGVLLKCDVLEYLRPLLSHTNYGIVEEAIWVLSNITAGSVDQIQAVFDAGLSPKIVELFNCGYYQIQHEAALTITNVMLFGVPSQILNLVANGALKPLCDFLRVVDSNTIAVLLNGLFSTLKCLPDHHSEISQMIEECSGLESIEKLQKHENEDVCKLAHKFIAEFFTGAKEHQKFKFDKSQEPHGPYFF